MPIEVSPRIMRSGSKRNAAQLSPTPFIGTQLASSPLVKHLKTPSKNAYEHSVIEEADKENVFMGVKYTQKDTRHSDLANTVQSTKVTINDSNTDIASQTISPIAADRDSIWTETRQSFHRSHCTTRLVGRDQEREALIDAIQIGDRIYVCGNPGTGKTALVNEVLASIKDYSSVIVNCAMSKANQFLDSLPTQNNKHNPNSCVLVLDEVDHWGKEEVSLFGNYHCIIGIANTLSLSNSLSTALIDGNLKVIRFMPYTVNEINDIIKARDKYGLIDDMAIELICRRTASASGDLRRALDMTVQCIDHLLTSNNHATRLTIKDVLSFLNTLIEKESELISTLSIHHRLIILLCPASSINALYDDYKNKTDTLIDALERSDFLDAVRLLASRNLLSLDKGNEKRQPNRVTGGRRLGNTPFTSSPQGKEWSQRISSTGKWTNEMLDKLKKSNAVLSVIFDRTE